MSFLLKKPAEERPCTCRLPTVPKRYEGDFGHGSIWQCDVCEKTWRLKFVTSVNRQSWDPIALSAAHAYLKTEQLQTERTNAAERPSRIRQLEADT